MPVCGKTNLEVGLCIFDKRFGAGRPWAIREGQDAKMWSIRKSERGGLCTMLNLFLENAFEKMKWQPP